MRLLLVSYYTLEINPVVWWVIFKKYHLLIINVVVRRANNEEYYWQTAAKDESRFRFASHYIDSIDLNQNDLEYLSTQANPNITSIRFGFFTIIKIHVL
jgi:hypothetical protein